MKTLARICYSFVNVLVSYHTYFDVWKQKHFMQKFRAISERAWLVKKENSMRQPKINRLADLPLDTKLRLLVEINNQ